MILESFHKKKDVLNVLTTQTPQLGYRSSMTNLIAKDCQANKRLHVPDNLECADYENPITQKTFTNPKKLQQETLQMRENDEKPQRQSSFGDYSLYKILERA